MQGKVEICGVNTSRLGVLSSQEMDRLLRASRDGDEQARQSLIEGNLRLVLSVIQRFDKRGESPDDLFQVGCIGLIKAISNFDPDKQVKFSTYGVPSICECRNSIQGVSTMTRKQALHKAIDALKLQGENEAAAVLLELHGELPLIHWSDSSIRDTVEQYILDHGKVPTASAFKAAGMPPHTVIKNKYGMILSEWLEANYPVQRPSHEEMVEHYTKAFIEDYYRIKPRSADEFNAKRSDKSRGWRSVARYHHVGNWRNLLKALGLPLYFETYTYREPLKVKVNFKVEEDFWSHV